MKMFLSFFTLVLQASLLALNGYIFNETGSSFSLAAMLFIGCFAMYEAVSTAIFINKE
jgi:hypothetical protein